MVVESRRASKYVRRMRFDTIATVVVAGTLSSLMSLVCACDDEKPRRQDLEAAAAAALGEGKDDKTKELEAAEAEARRKAFEARRAD